MNVPEWIAGCTEVERKMAELYGSLSDKFVGERQFFATLRREELEHKDMLDRMDVFDEEGATRNLQREARLLLRTLDAADIAIEKVRTSAMGLEEALRLALVLEEGVVENFVTSSGVVSGDNSEANLRRLLDDSTNHAERIRKALIRNGFMYLS